MVEIREDLLMDLRLSVFQSYGGYLNDTKALNYTSLIMMRSS